MALTSEHFCILEAEGETAMSTNKGSRSIEGLADEQVHRWQYENASRVGATTATQARPIITLSRLHASGGVEHARRLAESLGYSFWHKEVVHAIATNANISEHLMAAFDEHRRDTIGELVKNLVPVDQNPSSSEYVRSLAKVLHALAIVGGAVIVGRGAQYLLDPKQLLRVRIVAPLEQRVANLVARGMSAADASKEIAAVDEDRRKFLKGHFRHDGCDPLDYDLTLNLGGIPAEAGVGLIVSALKARFPDRA